LNGSLCPPIVIHPCCQVLAHAAILRRMPNTSAIHRHMAPRLSSSNTLNMLWRASLCSHRMKGQVGQQPLFSATNPWLMPHTRLVRFHHTCQLVRLGGGQLHLQPADPATSYQGNSLSIATPAIRMGPSHLCQLIPGSLQTLWKITLLGNGSAYLAKLYPF
jgi:hypothetical protein